MASEERLRELEEKYEGYKVYDNQGDRIGKVDDLFVDETDHEEYFGVKMGLFGLRSTLIPTDIVRVNEADRTIEVSDTKDHVKDAPNFDDDDDITPDFERRIRDHFGLAPVESSSSSSYGAQPGTGAAAGAAGGPPEEHHEDHDDHEDHDEVSGRDPEARDERAADETVTADETATADTGHPERSDSTAATAGATSDEGREESSSQSTGHEGGGATERFRSGGTSSESGGYSGDEGSREASSAGTGGTETSSEGGRPKVRRRIIREEIIEEPDDR